MLANAASSFRVLQVSLWQHRTLSAIRLSNHLPRSMLFEHRECECMKLMLLFVFKTSANVVAEASLKDSNELLLILLPP